MVFFPPVSLTVALESFLTPSSGQLSTMAEYVPLDSKPISSPGLPGRGWCACGGLLCDGLSRPVLSRCDCLPGMQGQGPCELPGGRGSQELFQRPSWLGPPPHPVPGAGQALPS